MSRNKLGSMQADVEPASASEEEEPATAVPGLNDLQVAVRTQIKGNVLMDKVDTVQNPIFQGNVEDPTRYGNLNHAAVQNPVATLSKDLFIVSVGETNQTTVNSFTGERTNTISREESTDNEEQTNTGSNDVSKRKSIISLHENSEVPLTMAATKMDGNAKPEDKTLQNIRSGSGQLISFTRRKRKLS
ncbi:hypothetical protein ACP4OV_008110 [Aristida adscensionis]